MPKLSAGLKFFSSEVRGLHMAAYVLALSAILSSLLALLRDRLLAHTFGASATLDLYYAAFRIPDLLFVVTASLVSAYVLIPEILKREGEAQRQYLDTVIVWFSLFVLVVAVIAEFLAPALLAILFPRFVAEGHLPELVLLTRILLAQPIILGLSNIFAAVTQAYHRYALYAATPLLYNVGIILGVVVLYPIFGISGLAWGVIVGALMHLGIQMPTVLADGFFKSFPRMQPLSTLRSLVSISVPRSLALSMGQLSFLGLIGLAGALTAGSISVFMFAYNLQAAPLAVIGASYSVAAFPKLAQMFSRGEREEFLAHVSIAARHIFFWSLPAIALIVVLRAYIVRIVLGSGAFDWTDTRLTAAALALLCVSLVSQSLTLLLVRGYYASGRTSVPFFMSAATAISAVALGFAFLNIFQDPLVLRAVEVLLRVRGVAGSSVLALPFAYSITAILGALFLSIHFNRTFGGFFARTSRTLTESIAAALAGGVGAYIALSFFGDITPLSTTAGVMMRGGIGCIAGLLCIAAVYHFIGNEEFKETIGALRRRALPVQPIVSAEDVAS